LHQPDFRPDGRVAARRVHPRAGDYASVVPGAFVVYFIRKRRNPRPFAADNIL
jgi:hypothetical protein